MTDDVNLKPSCTCNNKAGKEIQSLRELHCNFKAPQRKHGYPKISKRSHKQLVKR